MDTITHLDWCDRDVFLCLGANPLRALRRVET